MSSYLYEHSRCYWPIRCKNERTWSVRHRWMFVGFWISSSSARTRCCEVVRSFIVKFSSFLCIAKYSAPVQNIKHLQAVNVTDWTMIISNKCTAPMFGDHKLPPKGIDCFMMTNDVNITITAAPCAEYKISVNVGNRQKYRHRHRLKSLTHYTLRRAWA